MSGSERRVNWFSESPSGYWSSVNDGISGGLTVGMAIAALIFFGLMTTGLGQPESGVSPDEIGALVDAISALGVGLFYMVIVTIYLVGWWLTSFKPEVRGLSVVDLGDPRSWIIGIPLGLLSGIIFVVSMRQMIGSFFAFETLTVFGVNIEPFVLIMAPVIMIPIAEELFFAGVMTPSLAEVFGVIPSAIIVSLIWNLWHLGTYGTETEILIALFAFRAIMTVVILYFESLMPSIVAHIVINFAGTFFVI